ncbi:hypothetical protein QEZ54_06825 [Catellatospora sp. KI3]|uniref:hypothetical protein n=1 Tax=Catellatospora sp. KI3 TaxID=3041620 RepID=UPI00248271C4|nr:hypothetical protein [Catellatospora sp. KI3]MDI1460672.1 hypothetical protein [Catellatospora sp. KI3]
MTHELFSLNEVLLASMVSLLFGAAVAAALLLPVLRRGAEGEPVRAYARRALSGTGNRSGRHHEGPSRPSRFTADRTRS